MDLENISERTNLFIWEVFEAEKPMVKVYSYFQMGPTMRDSSSTIRLIAIKGYIIPAISPIRVASRTINSMEEGRKKVQLILSKESIQKVINTMV